MQDPYDAVPYPALPFADTHPDTLATMATLHGLSPAPVSQCRVLEIGCNEGANLIPMAYAIPGSEFVGFDLANLPINRGQALIGQLGLKNIRLFQANLMDVGEDLGTFDYVIAHGLYAWVPLPVRDGLLSLVGRSLARDGVAFVSYNAFPGAHLRKMMREMMLFKVSEEKDADKRVSGALQLLQMVSESRPENDAYRVFLGEQLKRLNGHTPNVTYHDELSDIYLPVYFHEFAAHAGQLGMQYLSESVLPPPPDPAYKQETRAAIRSMVGDDLIRQEQMLDFLRARVYRETLLCKSDRVISRDFGPEVFRRLKFSSQVTYAQDGETGGSAFVLPGGIKMESNHPGVVAMLKKLEAEWPRALSFAELEPLLEGTGLVLDNDGATLLMRLAVAKMIELHTWNAPVAGEISARPRASAYTRLEIQRHRQGTTLMHSMVKFEDPVVRSFLGLLDGTREREDVLREMKAAFPEMPGAELEEGFESSLKFLFRAGFLEA